FNGLSKWGVRIIGDEALDSDPAAHSVKLARGEPLGYDRLILSPGVDFIYDDIPSLASPEAQARVLHAWKAGPQTAALRAQLEAIPTAEFSRSIFRRRHFDVRRRRTSAPARSPIIFRHGR